jgi:hypothetical protein
MEAIRFIVDMLLWLLTAGVRAALLFQLVRADFRDPMADAIVRVTNWLICRCGGCCRRIGKIDTATVVRSLLIAACAPSAIFALSGGGFGRSAAVHAHHACRPGRWCARSTCSRCCSTG